MEDWDALFDLAVEHHQTGDLEVASGLYRRILSANPAQINARYLLGTLLLQQGDSQAAITELEPLLRNRRDIPDLHNNLGIAYHALSRWEDAISAFRAAIELKSNYQQAHFNLAMLLEEREDYSGAEHYYRQASELDLNDPQCLFNLGHVLKVLERWEDAEDAYLRLSTLTPDNLDVLINLGYVQVRQERLDQAIETYHRLLLQAPDYAEVHNNLSYVFERMGLLEDAIDSARKAIQLKPHFPEGFNNLGTAYRTSGMVEESIEAFDAATRLQSDFPLAQFNLGTSQLLKGNFERGWEGYEHRTSLIRETLKIEVPRWVGEPISGRKLLIYSDQGFGDAIQFIRYLPQLKERTQAEIILLTPPPLARLFAKQPGFDQLILEGEPLPLCDASLPLLSVPRILELNFSNLRTKPEPYLKSDVGILEFWRSMLPEWVGGKFRVGVVWQGNPRQSRDRLRSCALKTFCKWFSREEIAIFSLQQDPAGLTQLEDTELPCRIVEWGSRFSDFADAAAALEVMDLVVTVDTAMCHLAGALGRPTWTLLSSSADWRWFLERSDSPWYPTMELIRQPTWGDWTIPLEQVEKKLDDLLRSRSEKG